MPDNVLILGAGFSYDAGIPMMSTFVDRMLDISHRGSINGTKVSPMDHQLLKQAVAIREELDGYHGRAVFDDRNIEDILSILAFDVLGGGSEENKKLKHVTKAITKTIDLCCTIGDPRLENGRVKMITDAPDLYRSFWRGLFEWTKAGNELPTTITFNYDLVLELSLLQLFNNATYDFSREPPFNRFGVHYHHLPELDQAFVVQHASYGRYSDSPGDGTRAVEISSSGIGSYQPIDILKLHGSLNFPRRSDGTSSVFAAPVDDPYILPPISHKLSDRTEEKMWREALRRIREARNVVFVGYRLPRTDIYMQYFLKAALGPNRGLRKITVFDPSLFAKSDIPQSIQSRYEDCFSHQACKLIDFRPGEGSSREVLGNNSPICRDPARPSGRHFLLAHRSTDYVVQIGPYATALPRSFRTASIKPS